MLAEHNPYASPQAELLLDQQMSQPAVRWEFVDHGFRIGTLIGLASLLILAACGILIHDAWLVTTIFFAMYGIPLAVFACFLLGVIAAGLDRVLQAVGLSKPPKKHQPNV